LYFDDCDSGAEFRDMLRFVLRLLVDLRDGGLEDFVDERRSGITTTGIAPLFRTSRRDLPLEEFVLMVVFEARLRCLFSGILAIE
jgi:hypothetical protein